MSLPAEQALRCQVLYAAPFARGDSANVFPRITRIVADYTSDIRGDPRDPREGLISGRRSRNLTELC